MAQHRDDVVEQVAMQLISSDASVLPVTAELSYRAGDPYTVRAAFNSPQSTSVWLLGRDLLVQGMLADADDPAGAGDVQVWRDEDPLFVLLSLTGIEGSALLAAPADAVEHFLTATEQLVPIGTESERMEGELTALIAALLTA